MPHIGHGYTEVAADVLSRWHRQAGDDTWFLTGTDEHGQKMLRTATANDMGPREWADKLVQESWIPLLETLDIANDDFIRTTQPRHEQGVAAFERWRLEATTTPSSRISASISQPLAGAWRIMRISTPLSSRMGGMRKVSIRTWGTGSSQTGCQMPVVQV